MTPDDPRHGKTTGYRAGCRCAPCRRACADAMASRRARLYLGRTTTLTVDNTGTKRRIQALAALGYSLAAVSLAAGYDRSHAALVLRREGRLRPDTVARFAEVYERLSMTAPPSETKAQKIDASRARRIARERGWAPPEAWRDIDDPDEQPHLAARDDQVDPVVVDRILAGRAHPANRAERAEVLRRWPATGRSLNDLERLTGWNVAREMRRAQHNQHHLEVAS